MAVLSRLISMYRIQYLLPVLCVFATIVNRNQTNLRPMTYAPETGAINQLQFLEPEIGASFQRQFFVPCASGMKISGATDKHV